MRSRRERKRKTRSGKKRIGKKGRGEERRAGQEKGPRNTINQIKSITGQDTSRQGHHLITGPVPPPPLGIVPWCFKRHPVRYQQRLFPRRSGQQPQCCVPSRESWTTLAVLPLRDDRNEGSLGSSRTADLLSTRICSEGDARRPTRQIELYRPPEARRRGKVGLTE